MAAPHPIWLDVVVDLDAARRRIGEADAAWRSAAAAAGSEREKGAYYAAHKCVDADQAIESALARLVAEIDGKLPAGPTWHVDLIRRVSVALPERRAPILTPETMQGLLDVRGFRHAMTHAVYLGFVERKGERGIADALLWLPQVIAQIEAFGVAMGLRPGDGTS
jgi:hypothetical protein